MLLVAAGLQYLHYVEFGAARRAIFRHNLVRSMREEVYLEELERTLALLNTAEECWKTIAQVCAGLNFSHIEMYFHETYFRFTIPDDMEDCDWSLTIPLGERGYLRLQRPNLVQPPTIAMSVVELLQRTLSKREKSLRPVTERLRGAA